MTTIRIFTNFDLTDSEFGIYRDQILREIPGAVVIPNKSGKADLCIVLNFSRGFKFAWGPNLKVIKLLQEPEVKHSIFHLFTWRHSRVFDRIYCHNARPGFPREISSPPLLANHLGTEAPIAPKKNRNISAIASTLSDLPGHRLRNQFVNLLIESGVDVDVFGKGRYEISKKIEGLESYRFSLAIENSVQKGYWTEKLSDCLLADTIPIYFGAPDVLDYFPAQSMIIVDIKGNPNDAISKITSLEEKDYIARLGALAEAKRLLESKYHLGVLARRCLADSHFDVRKPRLARIWTVDSLLQKLFEVVAPVFRTLKNLVSFAKAR